MKNIIRTIWGAALQTNQLPGIAYQPPPNTTLNERFNVQSGVQPPPGKIPRLAYLGAGCGAHIAATGVQGFPLMPTLPHYTTDAAAFLPMPLCIRPLANDLSSAQMAKYAMRVVQTLNGVPSVLYYLRRIDFTGIVPVIQYNRVDSAGQVSQQPYNATTNNLNPTRPTADPTGVVTPSPDYLTVSMVMNLGFTEQDVQEYSNAATLIWGGPQYAVISELLLCTGLDQPNTTGTGAAGNFQYNEAIAVQVHSFVNDYINVSDSDLGFDFNVQCGAQEPLLTTSTQVQTSGLTLLA